MMAFDMSSIVGTRHSKPPRIIIHGGEKVGKSSFFAGAPNPIFIQTEDGLSGIDAQAFPLATEFSQVMDALATLCEAEHDFQTVVIDSVDWMERLIHKAVIDDWNRSNGGNAEVIDKTHGGYGKGYVVANGMFRDVLQALDYLCQKRGMIVGMICHSKLATISEPDQEPIDIYRMKLHSPKSGNGAGDILNEWADVIGFASIVKRVTKRETQDAGYKSIKGMGERVLHLDGSPAFIAGNRYGLPPELPLDWASFQAALNQSTQAA